MRLAVERTEVENLFETLANNSPVGLCIIQDGKFCYTNPTFQSNTGYTEDELLGRDPLELIVPEDREMARENAVKMLKEKLTLPHQFRVLHNDGSIHWVVESVASIQYRGRRATMGTFVDITERKQAEEALRASEEMYKAVVEDAPIGIYYSNFNGTLLYGNKKAEEIVGYKIEELLDKSFHKLKVLRPEGIAKAAKLLALSKLGKASGPDRFTLNRKDGTTSIVEIRTKVSTVGGKKAVLGMVEDITKRKRTEETLKAERNKLQALIDAMEDGLTIQDRDYNIIYQNEQARIASGGDRLGEKCYRVYEDQEKICKDCPVEKAFKDGKPHTSERQRILPSGELSFWETTANPIRDARGRVVSCLEIGRNITEHKKAEQALADELTRRRLLVDQSLDGIVVLDADAKVCEANHRFAEMLGYTLEEVHELHTWDWDKNFPPEQILEMGRNVDEKGLHLETKHTRKDGSVIDVDISISGIMYGGQKLIFCIGRDVTERKKTEQALADEATRRHILFDQSIDGMVVLDENGKVYESNQRFAEMLGYTLEEVHELHMWDWDIQWTREQLLEMVRSVDEIGDHIETYHRRKDGTVYNVEISSNGAMYEGQKLVFCVCRDVTERKQAEEKLKLLSSVTQQVSDAIIITGADFNITYVNKAAEELFGCPAQEMLGKHMDAFNAEPLPKSLRQEIAQTVSFGKLWVGTLAKKRKDGSTFLSECRITPLYDKDGKISLYIEVLRDITERKKAEEKVQHLNLVLHAIRNINQLIARSTDRDGLLKGACDTFVKTRGYYSAWIALLDESGKLVTAAEAGLGKSFLQVMERLKHGELTHCGCKVLEKPGILVMKDVSSECEDCPVAKEHTGRAAMSIRLEYGSKVYGLMTVSIPPGRAAEKEEHDLFEEIAEDIAFALHSMEQKQERKQAEEALQTEKNKLQSLVDAMEDGLTIQDRDYNIIYEGRLQRTILGDHVGEKCYRVYEGREKVCEECPVEKAFKDGKSHTAERRTVISGEVFFWENTANPIRDASGEIVSCLEINRNITERKRVEEILRGQSEDLQLVGLINDATNQGYSLQRIIKLLVQETKKMFSCYGATFYSISEDKKYLIMENLSLPRAVTSRIEQLTGAKIPAVRIRLQEGSLYLKSLQEGKPRIINDRETIYGLIAECTENKLLKKLAPRIYKLLKIDSVMHVPLVAEGEIIGMVDMSRQQPFTELELERFANIIPQLLLIIKRKEAGDKVRQQNEFIGNVLNSLTYPFYVLDINDYTIKLANPAAGAGNLLEKPTCYSLARHGDKPCGGAEHVCPLEEVQKTKKLVVTEHIHYDTDGQARNIEVHGYPIFDTTGKVVQMIEYCLDITERKQADAALQTEKNKLQSLIDSMDYTLTIQDAEYNIIYQNEQSRIASGGDHLGEKCYRAYEGRETVCDGCPVEEAVKDGETHTAERRREISGKVTFWENTATPIRDSAGKIVSSLELARDITERKKAEQALADEATRRRLLVDQSLDGIVVLDADAKVCEANQRFAEMLGYTLEEVHELHTWDWDKNFPPEQILEMGRNVDEKGLHLETKHTRKDGSVIDVDISISGIMYGGQKLIFCIGRDVTERKKMEKAIKLAAEEWRNTFDSISDAISIHARDFKIQRVNKAFADLFHKKPHQIIGKHCYELHHGGKPIAGCPHKQTLATKQPAVAEFYEPHLGKYFQESTSPILDEQGEVVGTVHITRDVTEQKQQNERLMMADRLASIGELAAGTAHELNNPLTSVIGFSQLLMEKDIPDDIREDLKLVHNEAQRAVNVTKKLLTFARKQAPMKQLTQINNIIEDVLKLRAYEHKVNGIEVERQLAPDLPEIRVDYSQMQQVFLNIIINAEYFMSEAHNRGTLTITTKKQNGNVRISIADDGPGISKENLRRIFSPFFTTKEAGKGTGLGLSICHGIVAEHGGQIYARNQPGKGATIFIELPVNSH